MTLDEAIQKTFNKYERAIAGSKEVWYEPCYLCQYALDRGVGCSSCPLQKKRSQIQKKCSQILYPSFDWITRFYRYPKQWGKITSYWPITQNCPRKTHKAKVRWLLKKRYNELKGLLKDKL